MNDLPPGWVMRTVGEVGEVSLGRQRAPKYHRGDGMRPYLRVANVFEDRIDTTDVMQMHFSDEEFERYRLQPGDVLLNEGQSPHLLGRPSIYRGYPPDVAFTNSLIRFRARSGVLPDWALIVFRHYMRSKRFMRESRITTNIAHLSATRFSSVEFPIPPLSEQERIVAAIEEQFSRVDVGIAALDRVRQKLKRMRAAVLEAAVTGRLLPRSNDSGFIVDGLPHGWSWQPLERLITRLRNGIFVSRPVVDPVGPPILRISSVRPLALDITDVRYVPHPDQLKRSDDFVLKGGDLLFTRYSGNPEYVGACAVVPPAAPGLLYPDKLIRVQVDRSLADPRFIAMAASAGRTRRDIRARVKTTAGQTGISGSDLRTVPFPLPPLEVQARIIEEVDESLDRIAALEVNIVLGAKRASSLRSSILAAAFSGRLVPQDLNDEPALVLLEQIVADESSNGQAKTASRKSRTAHTKAIT